MIKVHCGVCNYISERNLNSHLWGCDECSMAAGNTVVGIDKEDIDQLEVLFKRAGEQIKLKLKSGSSVLPIFRHDPKLTPEILDILVLFFDHIILLLDTFDIKENDQSQLKDKIEAYIDYDYITVAYWNETYSDKNIKVNGVNLRHGIREMFFKEGYPMPLDDYIQVLAEYQTQNDIKNSPKEFHILDRKWFDSPRHPHPSLILNRINCFSTICEMIDCSGIYESWFRPFQSIKFIQNISKLTNMPPAADAVMSWYGKAIENVPKFKNPEGMIKFRENIDRNSFVNFLVNEYLNGRSKFGSAQEASTHLSQILNNNLNIARKITSESYKKKSQVLSGLFATLGALIGNTPGALIGGIGGTMAVQAIEKMDKSRVEKWATFFIE